MAPRKGPNKTKFVAKIVTGKKLPCSFCQCEVDDELSYGKLYAIGDIQCHYFCVLLSSCLIQRSKDTDGLFGFTYEDILREIERAKKHRCSYCGRGGANLGCSVSKCRKQFHLPCGRERNAVSMFYGNYKSFCQSHAPKQNIPAVIMAKAKLRKMRDNKVKMEAANFKDLKELSNNSSGDDSFESTQSVCVICYEAVDGYPTINTFWPPCCARDAWFHRSCLQRMALSAGMHYLKCPLCNDKDNFYQAVVTQGYYVPDRDAAWELEQNAFSEIYEREVSCSTDDCQCPMGRSHDADQGSWSITLCLLCGSSGAHTACLPGAQLFVCAVCAPSAQPEHIERLATCIQQVITEEQRETSSRTRRGPVMTSRMSLRRTKRHTNEHNAPSSSSTSTNTAEVIPEIATNTSSSRQILNLSTPKKPTTANILENLLKNKCSPKKDYKSTSKADDFKSRSPGKGFELYISPTKFLEDRLKNTNGEYVMDKQLVEDLRKKFKKPKPLCEKKKMVNDILSGLFDNLLKDSTQKQSAKQWREPHYCDISHDCIQILHDTPPSQSNKENSRTATRVENNPEETSSFTSAERASLLLLTSTTERATIHPECSSHKLLQTVHTLTHSALQTSDKHEILHVDDILIQNNQNEQFLKQIELTSPEKSNKCAFKFSPYNKEVLAQNIDIDVERFKDQYLNEVGLQRVVKKEVEENIPEKKSSKKHRKRKRDDEKIVLKYESKKRKKNRKNISIKDKNIQVKIKWRQEQFKLKITDSKKKKKCKKFKQYILECSPKNCSTIKPQNDITPLKRKYIKQEKTPDNLVQTCIHKFFKIMSPKD